MHSNLRKDYCEIFSNIFTYILPYILELNILFWIFTIFQKSNWIYLLYRGCYYYKYNNNIRVEVANIDITLGNMSDKIDST